MAAMATAPAPPTRPAPPTHARERAPRWPDTPLAVPQERPTLLAMGIVEPTKKQIRERAYQIYVARGGNAGDAVHDWCRAERELWEEARASALPRRA